MKLAALRALIERMENQVDDDHFVMSTYVRPIDHAAFQPNTFTGEETIPYCKTAGCIAGQVFLGLTPEEREPYVGLRFTEAARQAAMDTLGIKQDLAYALFEPGAYRQITREIALKALKGIEADGILDWRAVLGFDDQNTEWHLTLAAREPIKIDLVD